MKHIRSYVLNKKKLKLNVILLENVNCLLILIFMKKVSGNEAAHASHHKVLDSTSDEVMDIVNDNFTFEHIQIEPMDTNLIEKMSNMSIDPLAFQENIPAGYALQSNELDDGLNLAQQYEQSHSNDLSDLPHEKMDEEMAVVSEQVQIESNNFIPNHGLGNDSTNFLIEPDNTATEQTAPQPLSEINVNMIDDSMPYQFKSLPAPFNAKGRRPSQEMTKQPMPVIYEDDDDIENCGP